MARKTGRKTELEKRPELVGLIKDALERGLTDEMACAEAGISRDTFYIYIRNIPDFADMVTRARNAALAKAVKAFASGLDGQQINNVEIDELKEIRLDRAGKPYTYTKTTTRKKIIQTPPDWRAGQAWLERRDRENWGNKIEIMLGVKLDILKELKQKADERGVDLAQVFEAMINEFGSITLPNSEE